METIKLQTQVTDDGLLKLELPTGMTNRKLEVLIVIQSVEEPEVDELGWPIGFFDRTYGALADDPIERPVDFLLDTREYTLSG
jgi:hypothetical protein